MSEKIAAERLQICVFVLPDKAYEDQSPEAQKIFDAFAAVVLEVQAKYGSKAPIELDFCPLAYDENAVIVAQQGLDLSRLPAAQVTAEYPDGTRRRYFLKTGIGGITFTPATVRPYVDALLYNKQAAPKPIICEIIPPACELGVWFWLAALAYTGYRTTQARNVGKVLWGGAALLTGEAFVKRGGLEQIKSLISGK